MRFTCSREKLLGGLQIVGSVVSTIELDDDPMEVWQATIPTSHPTAYRSSNGIPRRRH